MARSEDVTIPAKTWTQLTNADVTSITFQNKSRSHIVQVEATVGAVAPSAVDGTEYGPGTGEYDLSLATAFPGVTGANRVWAYATRSVTVFVSHA